MELRFPAAQGGILLMRSLAVQPLSFFAFLSPLYSNSWSLAVTASDASAPAPPPPPLSVFGPGSEDDDAMIEHFNRTQTKQQQKPRERNGWVREGGSLSVELFWSLWVLLLFLFQDCREEKLQWEKRKRWAEVPICPWFVFIMAVVMIGSF